MAMPSLNYFSSGGASTEPHYLSNEPSFHETIAFDPRCFHSSTTGKSTTHVLAIQTRDLIGFLGCVAIAAC